MSDNKREISDLRNVNFGNNANLQGDNVAQINIEEHNDLKKALESLKGEVCKITDEIKREESEVFTETLVGAIEKRDILKIKRCLSSLRDRVSDFSSIITIATFFGLQI